MRVVSVYSISNDVKPIIIFLLITGIIIEVITFGIYICEKNTLAAVITGSIIVVLVIIAFWVGMNVPYYYQDRRGYYVEIEDQNNATELLQDYNIIQNIGTFYQIEDK